jgi:16S rRNA (guanine966-N2)-methyltransferase
MLASRLGSFEGLRVADLYAGSGALGFEALSRGAAHVTFVETDQAARTAIAANARAFGAEVAIAAHSAAQLPQGSQFDLILADPPYAVGSGTQVAEAIQAAGWLAPGGWLAVETHRSDRVDPKAFEIEAERDSGRARLTILRRPA